MDIFGEVSELTQEFRFESLVESEHVVQHEHLSVSTCTSTYAYSRAADGSCDARSKCGRYLLEHDTEAAGFIQQSCVSEQFVSLSLLLGTQTISAELVDTLRR